MDWRPISTAPQDGSDVVIYIDTDAPVNHRYGMDSYDPKHPWCEPYTTHWLPRPTEGWLPIETAPKDGTVILSTNGRDFAPGLWEDPEEPGEYGWYCTLFGDPTHWMPFDPPT